MVQRLMLSRYDLVAPACLTALQTQKVGKYIFELKCDYWLQQLLQRFLGLATHTLICSCRQ